MSACVRVCTFIITLLFCHKKIIIAIGVSVIGDQTVHYVGLARRVISAITPVIDTPSGPRTIRA